MRVLLTGSTGLIGSEILTQCLKHNYITKIYILTRKPLDQKYTTHPKVTQILHDDFATYPEHQLIRLRGWGIEACIWALGERAPRAGEAAERVGVGYSVAAAEAFARVLATALDPDARPNTQKFPFRFVFISGWGAETDQNRTLWLWSTHRKIKGAAETGIFGVADASEEVEVKSSGKRLRCFEAFALRAGTVLAAGDGIATVVTEAQGLVPAIAVDRLARMAVKVALEGTAEAGKRVLENRECLGEDWAMVNTLTI